MASYARVTLGDLKNRLTERLGNNSTFWVGDEKRDAIMEAVLIWQCMTGELNRTFSIPSGTEAFYAIPHQIGSLRRVSWNGSGLIPISKHELDFGYPGWPSVPGTPLFWCPVGLNMVALYPYPITGSITFDGYAEVPRLVGDGDFIQLGEEDINNILSYAHHYCTLKEGGQEFDSASGLFKNFIKGAGVRNARLKAVDFYRKVVGQHRDELERPARSLDTSPGIRG